ncbi:MAG: tyrosine--tRNA ligase [Candidatus Walczuchella monophlebidarum]
MKDLIQELSWRGLLKNITPGLIEKSKKRPITLYVGFDPTADSLHIGNLLPILLLIHFERAGHHPIAVLGGATGMIGDPSGKSSERQLLDKDLIEHNIQCLKEQLSRLLYIKSSNIRLLNNYDWISPLSFIEFVRDVGKHFTINYMLSKDSIKKRFNPESPKKGMSFTEFTYQLLQGYDFYHLYKNENCLLQIGGSDQWGNIVTGIELIRKKTSGTAYGLTFPLVTKYDGTKFGKSKVEGNIWLDAKRTSPYIFFQFWMNISDDEAIRFIKMYTLLPIEEIDQLIEEHKKAPNKRILQQILAKEITQWIYSTEYYNKSVYASKFLFNNNLIASLKDLDKKTFISIFEGVPRATIFMEDLLKGVSIIEVLTEKSGFFSSKGEARRSLKEKSISVNHQKVDENFTLSKIHIIAERYILLKKGKKKYLILEAT